MIEAVLFDMDDTLVSNPVPFDHIRDGIIEKLKDLGMEEELEALERGTLEGIANIGARHPHVMIPLIKALEALEMERAESSFVSDESLEMLKWLKKKGIKIAVVTRNSRPAAEFVLSPVIKYIDALVTRDDVQRIKPHADHLRAAMRALDIDDPARVLTVGDYRHDMASGKSAGCLTVGLNVDGGDHRISGIGEVRDIIEETGE